MNQSLVISESILGSLCREIEYIRNRYKHINNSLINSKDLILRKRLLNEMQELKGRRSELLNISQLFFKNYII